MNLTFAWVAIVYFVCVWIWRRFASPLPWRVAIFFYLLVLIFLWQPLTANVVNVPADYLGRLHPWRGLPGDLQNRNPEINDVILQMVPWAHQAREALLSLRAPLWNEAAGGGYPLLANGQSAALSPLRVVSLPLPLGFSLACEAALKILAALTFTWLYARRYLSERASTIAAVSFGFSTFIVVWLYFPHSSTTAFLPAVLLGIELLWERITARRFVFLTLAFAMLLLTGHPESAAHSVFAAGLLLLWHLIKDWRALRRSSGGASDAPRPLASVGAITLAGILAVLVSAPFVFPFLEALPLSQRYQWLKDQPTMSAPSPISFLVPFIHVDFYGTVKSEQMWGPGIAEVLCGFVGILGWIGWWCGALRLGTKRSWREWPAFLVVTVPIVMSIALAWRGAYDIFEMLPLFSLAANGRLRLVVCLLLALLAGVAIDELSRDRARLRTAALLTAAMLAIPFILVEFPSRFAFERSLFTSLPRWLVVAAVLLATIRFVPRRAAALLILPLAIFDLWSFGRSWNPVVPAAELYPETPMTRFLRLRSQEAKRTNAPFRVAGRSAALFPNSAAMYGLEDIRSHDPMSNGRYLGVLRVLTGYSSDEYFGMLTNTNHPILDFLNVRYVLAAPGDAGAEEMGMRAVYRGRDGVIYENRDALPRFFAPLQVINEFDDHKRFDLIVQHQEWGDTAILKRIPTFLTEKVRKELLVPHRPGTPHARVRLLRSEPTRFVVDVNAPRWTLVVSSQPAWPGWKVFDSKGERLKIIEVNEAFIGFVVPPGRTIAEVTYRPRSFHAGVVLSVITLLGLATLFVFAARFDERLTKKRAA